MTNRYSNFMYFDDKKNIQVFLITELQEIFKLFCILGRFDLRHYTFCVYPIKQLKSKLIG